MACLANKLLLGGSLAGLAGSGVIAILGAPTVVLSIAGGASAVASLTGVIASLISLKECYERHGRREDAEKLARAVESLQLQLTDLRTRFGLS